MRQGARWMPPGLTTLSKEAGERPRARADLRVAAIVRSDRPRRVIGPTIRFTPSGLAALSIEYHGCPTGEDLRSAALEPDDGPGNPAGSAACRHDRRRPRHAGFHLGSALPSVRLVLYDVGRPPFAGRTDRQQPGRRDLRSRAGGGGERRTAGPLSRCRVPVRRPRTGGSPPRSGRGDGAVGTFASPRGVFTSPPRRESGNGRAHWDSAPGRWQRCTGPVAPRDRRGLGRYLRAQADEEVAMPTWRQSTGTTSPNRCIWSKPPVSSCTTARIGGSLRRRLALVADSPTLVSSRLKATAISRTWWTWNSP